MKDIALDLSDSTTAQLIMSPYLYICGALYLGQMLTWIGVLRTIPLSIAYPFTSLTVITILASGVSFFGESLDLGHVVGSLTIMAGISILMHNKQA